MPLELLFSSAQKRARARARFAGQPDRCRDRAAAGRRAPQRFVRSAPGPWAGLSAGLGRHVVDDARGPGFGRADRAGPGRADSLDVEGSGGSDRRPADQRRHGRRRRPRRGERCDSLVAQRVQGATGQDRREASLLLAPASKREDSSVPYISRSFGEETGPLQPVCRHLRSKAIYVAGQMEPSAEMRADGQWPLLVQPHPARPRPRQPAWSTAASATPRATATSPCSNRAHSPGLFPPPWRPSAGGFAVRLLFTSPLFTASTSARGSGRRGIRSAAGSDGRARPARAECPATGRSWPPCCRAFADWRPDRPRCLSVEPITVPPRTPPPAKNTVCVPQWSRPGLA